ncbi:hypothetical protein CABS01_06499 [Colletotrichum abscissum]|uniref:Alpha/beta hydrolase fold-3 domain-containing protein n=1 Tax=Colletotrichum abscissum TaxID=1671311 RepID=A0A9Q0B497_9PEZI|nr:uncharacterized protein CABS01_06499 [Colletotrichum abscissum]KAI3552163.1 hypothetical protein CABS02_07064 [Colletotrichum abscissum]KAK1516532.1 hypothetical protein CABS01_06499 [Colletotrichum abscissum]
MLLLQVAIKPLRPRLASPSKLPPNAERLTPPKNPRKCHIEERELEGLWLYDITQKSNSRSDRELSPRRQRRILYFAGGGWQMPPSKNHWTFCMELVRRLDNTTVTIISAPLAPKHPVSVAFPCIQRAYSSLLSESHDAGESVIVAGDSSGGNIALSLVAWTLKHPNKEVANPPVAVIAISPTVDLRHELPEIRVVEKSDSLHTFESIKATAEAWCPKESSKTLQRNQGGNHVCYDWGLNDPRVSPIHADLGVFLKHNVRIYGVSGSYDVLAPEAIAFRNKCKEHGVSGEWLSWERQMHCFPLMFKYGLKEGKEGMDWMIHVLDKH